MPSLTVSNVRFRSASPEQVGSGLIGFVTIVLADAIEIGGIALRRTLDGKQALSFPQRTDRHGQPHYVARPINERVHRDLERQVFDMLAIREEAS